MLVYTHINIKKKTRIQKKLCASTLWLRQRGPDFVNQGSPAGAWQWNSLSCGNRQEMYFGVKQCQTYIFHDLSWSFTIFHDLSFSVIIFHVSTRCKTPAFRRISVFYISLSSRAKEFPHQLSARKQLWQPANWAWAAWISLWDACDTSEVTSSCALQPRKTPKDVT